MIIKKFERDKVGVDWKLERGKKIEGIEMIKVEFKKLERGVEKKFYILIILG